MNTKVNDTDLQVLSLFTKSYQKPYHIREVERQLKISSRTAKKALDKLEYQTILSSKLIGKTKLFFLQHNEISKRMLILAEEYKTIVFLENKHLIKEISERIYPSIQGIGILFGSYAKNLERKSSDLDIFICGKYSKDVIKETSNLFNIQINVKCYPEKVFKAKITQDILLKEVLKNHIILKGTEAFVRTALQDEQNKMVFE